LKKSYPTTSRVLGSSPYSGLFSKLSHTVSTFKFNLLDGAAKDSDLIDEFMRQIQKPLSGESQLAIGHADLHRVIKDMVKAEVAGKNDEELHLCKTVANILLKDLEAHISTRAVFILIELLEHDVTKQLVFKQAKAALAFAQRLAEKDKGSSGLQILIKKLSE
jgi:hypothetical protein